MEQRRDETQSPLRVLPPEPLEAQVQAQAQVKTAAVDQARMEIEDVQQRLEGETGQTFWRSLEELAETKEFQELAEREFPRYLPAGLAGQVGGEMSRRQFLQLAGASMALAGLAGCTAQPDERIVPYVDAPEGLIPGKPLHYATAATQGGYAVGLLVESHMGRPTKIEGNPDHPFSLGASDARTQAEIYNLYDPDRSRTVRHLGRVTGWDSFTAALGSTLTALEALEGDGLRILTGASTSPTLKAQMDRVLARFPKAQWHQYEPANRDNAHQGARRAYGAAVETHYDLTNAKVVVLLESDLLADGPGHLAYARQFADHRRGASGDVTNRLYAVESTPSASSTLADHRLPLKAGEIPAFAAALAAELGVAGAAASSSSGGALSHPKAQDWVKAVAADLQAHPGESLVVAGDALPAAAHVLVHAINEALGGVGATVFPTDPVQASPPEAGNGETQLESLRRLVDDMNAGTVEAVFTFGANPVYNAPAELGFLEAFQKVPTRVHLGLYEDETGANSHWHIPEAHFLEGWSDARALDGTVTLVQPLIEPLHEGRTVHELLALLANEQGFSAYELVEKEWQGQLLGAAGGSFEKAWRKALHDGWVPDTALPAKAVSLDGGAVAAAAAEIAGSAASDLELALRPDPSVYDGRHANNGWLQETPNPVTKLTWDNALLVAPATVERLGLAGDADGYVMPDIKNDEQKRVAHLTSASGKVVKVTAGDRTLEVPLWVVPGQADGTLVLHLGYGRKRAGRIGDGTGFDAYQLQSGDDPWLVSGVAVERTGAEYPLASTQLHHNIALEGEQAKKRHLIRSTTVGEFKANEEVIHDMGHAEMAKYSLYEEWEYNGYAWGMAIDLNACTGCNACMVACQAENNIPIVGKEQVMAGREMHWIRIDRYYAGGDINEPQIYHQPVPCMHCEQAPCEVVCPVAATVHSDEGLNDMVYNRCVGTRYCSNNCPYKVRRFNWFNFNNSFHPNDAEEMALWRNPDVTVRFRGVMEKCTYCVQRINEAKIGSKLADRKVQDGEIRTACQQACPTQAIAFGDQNDESTEVGRWKASPLNYALLEELGTRPRTTYLAKLRNPNPELEEERSSHGGH
jgi:molybdopterin-containing oxidoreductase family iron-sulfur binding subunit